MGFVGFGSPRFGCSAYRYLQRPWVSGRGRCPFLELGLGRSSVVAFRCSYERRVAFLRVGARRLPISGTFGAGCVSFVGLCGSRCVCNGCRFGTLRAPRLNSSRGQASPISVYFGLVCMGSVWVRFSAVLLLRARCVHHPCVRCLWHCPFGVVAE